ncbi:glycosyltransferase family 4 protein [Pseudanabaena biceps]|nr:glycosyltransferase family 4 protein [Pseudanabaena biceps]
MKNRVLIVSPHFPPINAADHQRIRMALPYFQEFGWKVTVLCVDPNLIEGIHDPNLVLTVPENIEIIQSSAISPQLSRKFRLGNLAFRSIPSLIKATAKYFEKNHFDLVYFSNTVFLTMVLGRYWLYKYKVPYILDFQDPWLSDYYDRTNTKPPGGKLKYAAVQSFAKILEPFTLHKASHITSVSPDYPQTLRQRYPWLTSEQFTVLPFGAPAKDFEILPTLNLDNKIFDPNDGNQHWVYVGRGGDDMSFSINALFSAIQKHRQRDLETWQKVKIHFIGTKYSIFDNSKPIEAIANSYNLSDIVTEYPQRIPYFEALKVLTDSHGILIIGSDDQGYSASKVYPCILSRKPILAILHQNSLVVNVIESCKAGQVVTFSNPITENIVETLTPKLLWLLSQSQSPEVTTDWQAFEPYTAKSMTHQLCAIFDNYVS